ncbi:hypothetical protein K2173_026089 [Erythroxylum novogranatense]|uniref:Yippee domain-containing protein n=1 Tax=Erythroxylum novogranatense TaxID=1862640 RepID=A0AAV8SI64_9ROSI|nr:hypothetical protein K2173_026089 [Erythroxylum novogranatense]
MEQLMGPRLYSYCNCRNHVSLHGDVISKAFQKWKSISILQYDRYLLTGLHTVADVYCANCREVLGWKYE